MFKSLVASLSLVTVVLAQNAALDVEAIEAHFKNAGLVPDLLSTFEPVAAMSVSFDGVGQIQPGQKFAKEQVQVWPSVTVEATNSSAKLDGNFTITMVDADAVGTDQGGGQFRHWLVNGVSLSGSSGSNQTIDNSSASAITDYAGPAPPAGSGAHRYVILLYTQPADFTPPQDLSTPTGVTKFSLSDYVSSTKLEGPVAGMYFTVEEGESTISVSATSAVETSTLSVASSTGSGSSSGSAESPSSSSAAMGRFEAGSAAGVFAGLVAAFAFA